MRCLPVTQPRALKHQIELKSTEANNENHPLTTRLASPKAKKNVSEMTYFVSMGRKTLTQSINQTPEERSIAPI